MYLKKLGLEGLPPACYDPFCRSSQAISCMEAGVGGCTAQQAVDLAHTEIRIQLTILSKASDCDEKCIIYVNVVVIYTNI